MHFVLVHFGKVYRQGYLLVALRVALGTLFQKSFFVPPQPQSLEYRLFLYEWFRIGLVLVEEFLSVVSSFGCMVAPVHAGGRLGLAERIAKLLFAVCISRNLNSPNK